MSIAAAEARARGTQHVLVAGARPGARSALGPHRGDLRRRSVPRLATRRRRRPRLPGHEPAARPRTRSSPRSSTSPATARTRAASTPRRRWSRERLLRDEFLLPFEARGHGGGAPAPSCRSYNEMDGVPSHVNRWLLDRRAARRVGLRRRWSSPTTTPSTQLCQRHHVAADQADAAAPGARGGRRLRAAGSGRPIRSSSTLVKDGRVSEAVLDRAVARILRAKFLAGLFEDPYVDADRAEHVSNTPEHQARRAGGGAPGDRAAEERGRRCCRSIASGSRRSRSSARTPRASTWAATRAIPAAASTSCSTASRQKAGAGVRVLYAEGTRDHRAATPTGTPTRSCSAIRRRTARASRRRSRSRARPTRSCS